MAHIVILGAGIGGMAMAYEMRAMAHKEDRVTVISNTPRFSFVPSNPWIAVNWRKREEVELEIAPLMKKSKIDFIPIAARRVHPRENRLEMDDDSSLAYDVLVIATGPKLAFDEIEGLGPHSYTQSVCHIDHAMQAQDEWSKFIADPGPIVTGAAQGASCFGPAYEFAFTMETDLRRRKIRDRVPMTFVTPEPFIGHLGLAGVGDSKGMLESLLREKHIKWICNAAIKRIEPEKVFVIEHDEDGRPKKEHELPFKYSMFLPAFKGVDAVFGIEGLTNPRGFILIDEHQRNPVYQNIFSVGVCVAIPPVESTAVPTGTPKTGYMIESMVTATAHNIRDMLDGKQLTKKATWNAVCLADFGDSGTAFVALPQIPPRNVNWFSQGKWVHLAKIAYEKYFMHKMKQGTTETIYEKIVMDALGIMKLKEK